MKIKKIIGSTIAVVMMLTCVMTMLPAMLASADSDNADYDLNYDGANDSNMYVTVPDEVKAETKMIEDILDNISECINKNNLKAQVLRIFLDRTGKQKIMVNYYYTHTDVKPMIEASLSEKNLDMSKVEFHAAGAKNTTESKKITDIYEKLALITDFCEDNNIIYATVNIIYDYDYAPAQIGITIGSMDKEIQNSISDSIHRFAEEQNIDMQGVKIVRYLKGSSISDDLGDANNDGTVNVRDCALIASSIASGKAETLPDTADYNKDGKKNVRDAAAISMDLANMK